jgi:ABC-type transport system involved in multi-copper enzyme maturation permease subunit
MNLAHTLVIAANVFRELIRDRILYLLVFFTVILIAATVLLPQVAATASNKIMLDLGLAVISLLGLITTAFVGAGLINKEIEKRTIYVMLAKPISRAELIVGKHWGLSAVLAVLLTAMTAIALLIWSAQNIPYPFGSLLLNLPFQLLELSLLAAAALLFSVFTSAFLATLMTLAVYVMGHFSRDLVTLGSLAESSLVKPLTQGLYLVLPDLSRLNLKNQAVYGMALLPQPLDLLGNFVYAVLYTVLLLAIAIAIFSRREF